MRRRLSTKLRLRETGREWKCIHPLGDSFGSLAVIAGVLLQQPEVIQLPLPRSPCGHHWIGVRRAAVCRRTRTGRLAGGERDARQRDEQGQDGSGRQRRTHRGLFLIPDATPPEWRSTDEAAD